MTPPTRRSNYRQLQAQMTRERIVEAARTLMSDRGWVATTIDAIAEQAGVASSTVYAAFGTKLAILEEMRHTMLRNARLPELTSELETERDPSRRLQLWATMIRQQMQSSYDIISIHRQAARADPAFAVEYRKVLDNRARHFAEFIHDLGDGLADPIEPDTATDLLWALSNEELWRELVEERGWSPDLYEQWLAATLVAQLITAPAVGDTARSLHDR